MSISAWSFVTYVRVGDSSSPCVPDAFVRKSAQSRQQALPGRELGVLLHDVVRHEPPLWPTTRSRRRPRRPSAAARSAGTGDVLPVLEHRVDLARLQRLVDRDLGDVTILTVHPSRDSSTFLTTYTFACEPIQLPSLSVTVPHARRAALARSVPSASSAVPSQRGEHAERDRSHADEPALPWSDAGRRTRYGAAGIDVKQGAAVSPTC